MDGKKKSNARTRRETSASGPGSQFSGETKLRKNSRLSRLKSSRTMRKSVLFIHRDIKCNTGLLKISFPFFSRCIEVKVMIHFITQSTKII